MIMDQEWKHLDAVALKALYEREFQKLSDDLLGGRDWQDVQDRRKRLIELTKLLYERASSHPAESPGRTLS
jgi:hypothetical protein